jgi:hypothetical protein
MLRVTTGDELSRLAKPSQATWCDGGWVPQNVVLAAYLLLKVFLQKILLRDCKKLFFAGQLGVQPMDIDRETTFRVGARYEVPVSNILLPGRLFGAGRETKRSGKDPTISGGGTKVWLSQVLCI